MPLFRRLLVFIFVFTSISTICKAQQWSIVQKYGGETDGTRSHVEISHTDKDGNTYMLGVFSYSITFGNKQYPSAPGTDYFLVKLDRDGSVIWVSILSGHDYDDTFEVNSMVVDDAGEVCITGKAAYSVDLGNNVKITIPPPLLGNSTAIAYFTCVYNENGTAAWAKFGGETQLFTSTGKIYAAQKLQNVYQVTYPYVADSIYCYNTNGKFDRTIFVDRDHENDIQLYETQGDDLWLRGYASGQSKIWRYNYVAENFSSPILFPIPDVTLDKSALINQSIYFWEDFYSPTPTIQRGGITLTAKSRLKNGYYPDGYLLKYDLVSQAFVWGKTILRMNTAFPVHVLENAAGDIYFGSQEVGTDGDNAIRAFSANGDSLWIQHSTAYILDCNGMGIDRYNNVYVTGGAFNGVGVRPAIFGPLSFNYYYDVSYWAKISMNYPVPTAPTNLVAQKTTPSSVTLKWEHTGDEVGFRLEQKPTGSTGFQFLANISTNTFLYTLKNLSCNSTNVYRVIALGQGSSSNPSNTLTVTLPKISTSGIQVSDTAPCVGSTIVLTGPTGFLEYHWNNGDTTPVTHATSTGQYTLVVTDSAHCISDTAKIKLNFFTYPNATISQQESKISIVEEGDQYQWYRDSELLPGETSSSIIPQQAGAYHASVTRHDCTVISDDVAFVVKVVTSIESSRSNGVKVFPIPSNNDVIVQFGDELRSATASIQLFTPTGSLLQEYSKTSGQESVILQTQEFETGIYFLKIYTGNINSVHKIILR